LSKRFFKIHDNKWKTFELFVGEIENPVDNNLINTPIIVTGESYFDKAVQFLHNRVKPDYPASANYFRKALEELIETNMFVQELTDNEYIQIPDYQLSKRLILTRRFFERSNIDTKFIDTIISLLNSLLHPLSHHEIESPIYKNELVLIERAFVNLNKQFVIAEIKNNNRIVIEKGKIILLTFFGTANSYYKYELKLKESIIINKDISGNLTILSSLCYLIKMQGQENGTQLSTFSPKKDDQKYNYSSIEDAVNKIHYHITHAEGKQCSKPASYIDALGFFDGVNWVLLNTKIVWI